MVKARTKLKVFFPRCGIADNAEVEIYQYEYTECVV